MSLGGGKESSMRRSIALLSLLPSMIGLSILPAGAVPPPSPPSHIMITESANDPNSCDFYDSHKGSRPLGTTITWENDTSRSRTVTQQENLWKFMIGKSKEHHAAMHWAGTLAEQCDGNAFDTSIKITPAASVSGS